MNDFLSQYKNEVARLQGEYQAGMSKLQEMARTYQAGMSQMMNQPQPYQPQPAQQPAQQPIPQQVQQPVKQEEPQFPHSIQMLAILGDIKGLLMKLVPEEKEAASEPVNAPAEAIVEQPVKQEDSNKKK